MKSFHRAARWLALTATLACHAAMSQPAPSASAPIQDDPYLWLEDVQGKQALDWVRERNAASQNELTARPSTRRSARRCWRC
jgi:prolyl oligopeptidase